MKLVALAVLALTSAAAPAFAATSDDTATVAPDPASFCYHAGQPYSEGAEHAGLRCVRKSTTAVFKAGQMSLQWESTPKAPSVREISEAKASR